MHWQIRRQALPFAVLCLLAVAAAGCDISVDGGSFSMDLASGKAQDELTRSYTVAPGGRFEVVNVNGVVEAQPADGERVEVRIERIAKASSDEAAAEMLKTIEIAEDVTADRVRLETKVPRQRFSRSGHEVRYYVRVPRGLSVSFETVNGRVEVENLEGEIAAATTNGAIRGSGLRGAVKASTTNGSVQIAMAAVTGALDLETTNGGIRLRLPADVKADLDARCTNGGISVSDFTVDGERSRRRVSGTINGGGPRIVAETTNGGIRISAAGDTD